MLPVMRPRLQQAVHRTYACAAPRFCVSTRRHASSSSSSSHSPVGAAAVVPPPPSLPLRSTSAIAFDIDGVLLRGRELLPTARSALKKVTRKEDGGTHPDGGLPHVYLTNGGGMTEESKAAQLSALFDIHIPVSSIIQSHTPMQSLLPRYVDRLVLTVGHAREGVRQVARHYGFKHLLIPEDLMHKYPELVPHLTNGGRMPPMKEAPVAHYEDELASIAAIFVLHDPVEWYRDLQLCLDVLVHPRPAGSPPVAVYFSNPDFLFSGSSKTPRLAAGAFRVCLEALYTEYTGQPLQYTLFGKPHPVTYKYAEKVLQEQALASQRHIRHVYGIGDNPASDIRGANAAGEHWSSVLVRSGCIAFSKLPEEQPKYEVQCVEEAVDMILKKEEEEREKEDRK